MTNKHNTSNTSNKPPQILQPDFYDRFVCTAGACPMTCCQEWTIGVDDRTLHRWEHTEMDGRKLTSCVERDFTGHHRIRLAADHRCPWLNEAGLCRIVLTHGDGLLSVTCDTFPRQNRHFPGRLEKSLLNSCPAVLDLLREAGGFRVTGVNSIPDTLSIDNILDDDDRLTLPALFAARCGVCSILADDSLPLPQAQLLTFLLLKDLWECEPEPDRALEMIRTLNESTLYRDYLPAVKKLARFVSAEGCRREQNELFLDLCENYRKEERYAEVLEPLCDRATAFADLDSPAKPAVSLPPEYDVFFRSLLISDCFASLLSETPDLNSMIRNYEWILLRFAGIRHALFLGDGFATADNSSSPAGTPTSPGIFDKEEIWPLVRQTICVISRMTGYSDEDIREVLGNMFDEMFWENGYAALLIGV